MSNTSFKRFSGDNALLRFNLVNPDDGSAFNPTGSALLFTVKRWASDADSAAKVQKLSTVGGFTTVDAANGIVDVELVPADWANLVAGTEYQVDVQAQNQTTGKVRTVGRGTLTPSSDVSKATTLAIATTVVDPAVAYLTAVQITALRDQAQASATAAAASALAAQNSATAAAASAAAALGSQNAASASAAAGLASQNAAAASAAAALASQNAGAASAAAAVVSQNAGAASAAASAVSAAAALASQNAAAASAAAALASQNAAAASAAAAATSEGNASASATNAATSAAQAAAIAAGLNYKGTQAGATVPNTSTSSGDCYLISSAGTSQAITWAAGDLAVYRGSSGNWDQITAATVINITQAAVAPFRNGLPPLQVGIFITGGSASPITVRDNLQFSYGTHDCAFDIWIAVATWTPAADRLIFCKFSGNVGVKVWLLTTGKLRFQIGNGANFTTYQYDSTLAASYPTWQYVQINASLTRAGNLIWSLNGIQLGAAIDISGSLAQTITNGGSFLIGGDGAASKTIMAVKKFTPFNDALTAADVTEIFLLGGELPYRLQFGTEDNILVGAQSDFSGNLAASGWSIANGTTTLDSNTTVAGKLYMLQAAAGLNRFNSPTNLWIAIKHRVSLKARLNAGAGNTLKVGKSSFDSAGDRLVIVPTGVETTFSGYITPGGTTEGTNVGVTGSFQIWSDAANSSAFEFDDVSLTRCGATAHYRFDEGGGLVAADSICFSHGIAVVTPKANGAILTAAGSVNPGYAVWLSANLAEQLFDAISSTNGNEQLFGQGVIDTCGGRSWLVTRILAYAFTGTPTIKVGISSGGAEIVAAVALATTAWTDLTLLAGKLIGGAGNSVSVWINSTTTDKVAFKILGRPL